MARFIHYLKCDWSGKTRLEKLLPVMMVVSIITQFFALLNHPTELQFYAAIFCIYFNTVVIISSLLMPKRYIDSPLGSLLNTYRIITDYVPFKRKQMILVAKLEKLMVENGTPEPKDSTFFIDSPLDLLELQVEVVENTIRVKKDIAAKAKSPE